MASSILDSRNAIERTKGVKQAFLGYGVLPTQKDRVHPIYASSDFIECVFSRCRYDALSYLLVLVDADWECYRILEEANQQPDVWWPRVKVSSRDTITLKAIRHVRGHQ